MSKKLAAIEKQRDEDCMRYAVKIAELQSLLEEQGRRLRTFEEAQKRSIRVDEPGRVEKTHIVQEEHQIALIDAWNRAGMPFVDQNAVTPRQFAALNAVSAKTAETWIGLGMEYRLAEANEFLSRNAWFNFSDLLTKDMENRKSGGRDARIRLLLNRYFQRKRRRPNCSQGTLLTS